MSILPPPSLKSWTTPDLFIISIVLPFAECHRIGTIQYVAFSVWPLSLRYALKVLPCLFVAESSFLFTAE